MFSISKSVRRAIPKVVAVGTVLAVLLSATYPVYAFPSPLAVPLGTAANFAVLGASGITNTGATTITTGDVGSDPNPAISGFPPGIVTGGTLHLAVDAATTAAQADLTTAYTNAAGRSVDATLAAQLGTQTLGPGVYDVTGGAALLTAGNLILNGSATDVWIFKITSTITTAGPSQVILQGTARAANVFWQVGASATIGTGTTFVGTIMAQASITLNTGATLSGRALARTGAVTLDTNSISLPPAAPSPAVGGEAYPINKFYVLVPWFILALIIVIGGSVLVLRRRTSR